MIKYSFLISNYNGEKYINKCLNSIKAQSYPSYEIIIIDDGSTDKSIEIFRKYQKTMNNLYVYRINHKGVGYSRDYAVKKATGEYIIFVDIDDYIPPDLLETLNKYQQEYDIIRFQPVIIKDGKEYLNNKYVYNKEEIYLTGLKALEKWSEKEWRYGTFWLYCFKKELVDKIYHFKCYEDVASIPLIIAKAKLVININYYGYYHLISNKSLMNTINNNTKSRYFKKACKILLKKFKYNKIIMDYYLFHLNRKKVELKK